MRKVIFCILLSSCAFKAEPVAKVQISSAAPTNIMTISFEDGGNTLNLKRPIGDASVTLPATPPKEVRIMGISKNYKPYVSPSNDGKLVALDSFYDGNILRIYGVDKLFPSEKMGAHKVYFSMDGKISDLAITFQTPPDAIEVTKFDIAKLPNFKRRISLSDTEFHSLYFVTIKNPSDAAVEYHLPVELKGELTRDFTEYNYTEGKCKITSTNHSWTDHYVTRFFLLPANMDFNSAGSAITTQENIITLQSGEESLFAVFGSGEKLQSFIDNGVPSSTHTIGSAHTVCTNTCPGTNEPKIPSLNLYSKCVPSDREVDQDVPVGIDSSPISWSLESDSTLLKARNTNNDQPNDPETRHLPFLSQIQYVL